ncbi:hypothetical protein Syn7502_02126 [Synechococcus sp. PCC 7502]|uniref:hypothetical protein n=1 Tax=Synechococcus sp. PCC 7502 TaxID=1173263 RepID=UPI00029F9A40|nr:hypothetical protein [Synechococcus sp. PCC 7502]AFY74141.1 hypothetical protein Syn7502_02126 [Synechococcus sp. PCC 7502]
MLNFSNHHSLKRRFQGVLTVLAYHDPLEDLSNLVDQIIVGNLPPISSKTSAILLGLYQHQDLTEISKNIIDPEHLIITLAIALACREQLQPRTLVKNLCDYLQPYPDLCSQLKLAHSLAEQGTSRTIARSSLNTDTLAFGIYCFLSTPFSWNLLNQNMEIAAIAAAYLGHIPNSTQNVRAIKLGMNLGDRLFAAWAGVYDLSNIPDDFYPALKYPDRWSLGA